MDSVNIRTGFTAGEIKQAVRDRGKEGDCQMKLHHKMPGNFFSIATAIAFLVDHK